MIGCYSITTREPSHLRDTVSTCINHSWNIRYNHLYVTTRSSLLIHVILWVIHISHSLKNPQNYRHLYPVSHAFVGRAFLEKRNVTDNANQKKVAWIHSIEHFRFVWRKKAAMRSSVILVLKFVWYTIIYTGKQRVKNPSSISKMTDKLWRKQMVYTRKWIQACIRRKDSVD